MADMRDDDLELFFEAGRADAPVPSQELMARIMADAEANMPPAAPVVQAAPKAGLFAGLLAAIGGWPAMAGLATATVAGIWIGYAQPTSLTVLAGGVWPAQTGYDVVDFVPSFDGFLVDG